MKIVQVITTSPTGCKIKFLLPNGRVGLSYAKTLKIALANRDKTLARGAV